MSRTKKLQAVIGIVASFVLLYVIGKLTLADSCMPATVFWVIAEMFLFADGYTVYSMIMTGSLSRKKR